MTNVFTRARVPQLWFFAAVITCALWVAFGTAIGIGSAVLLIGLGCVPPAIVVMLWPGVQPQTVSEVLRGTGSPR